MRVVKCCLSPECKKQLILTSEQKPKTRNEPDFNKNRKFENSKKIENLESKYENRKSENEKQIAKIENETEIRFRFMIFPIYHQVLPSSKSPNLTFPHFASLHHFLAPAPRLL